MIRNYLVCCLVILSLFLGACAPEPPQETNVSRIVYGLTLSPSGFDPHRNESAELTIPMRQIYDTLVYRNPETGVFVAGLATDWTISTDRMQYTFNLRQDVKFHDGTTFNALAVAENLDRIMNPDTRSTKAKALLGTYSHYSIDSEYTITLHFSEPFSPLLDSLSQVYLGIASPAALIEYAATPERYQYHQVGTGPYKMVELVLDNRLVIARNPDYAWGPEFYLPADDNMIDEIEFRFFADSATRFSALESGDAQVMGELPPLTARSATGNREITLQPVTIPGQPLQFLINTQKAPTDNLTFRQALLYGTNRSAISDLVFQGFSPIAWGPLTTNTQFYSREMNGFYDYNLDNALAFLTTLGYTDTDGDGFLNQADGSDVELRIIAPPWGATPQVAQLLQDQWRNLGIKVVIQPVPDFSTLLSEVESGDYHLVAFHSFGVDPSLINSFYMTDGAHNWTNFSNQELDTMLSDGLRQLESGTRSMLYARAQRIIMENALVLPIRDYVNLNGISHRLQNLTFDPYGWVPMLANVRLTDE